MQLASIRHHSQMSSSALCSPICTSIVGFVPVDLPLPSTPVENPWLRFAGIWEHDPDREAFQAATDSYGQEIDAQFQPE
jgi:hypothetical protein